MSGSEDSYGPFAVRGMSNRVVKIQELQSMVTTMDSAVIAYKNALLRVVHHGQRQARRVIM